VTIRDSIRSFGSAAPVAKASAPRPASRRVWRAPLAAKLAAALIGLVILVLLVDGAINTWLNYNEAKRAALEVQEEKARSAAVRVDEFLAEIETQLGWTTGVEWRRAQPDQRRYDFVRLLRQVPAITELSYLDGQGKEQLKVSRLEPDSIGSDRDLSKDPRFVQAIADKIWFGPVEFRRGSEPYMTIALAHVGRDPGVTVADVNLKLIWDVVSAIRVGEKGYAYVVDDKGRLIAHPDLSLVLGNTDFSHLPQVKQALDSQVPAEPRASAMAAPRVGMAEIATAFDGGSVLTAYAVAPRTNWIVFVQQPVAEALASVYRSLLQTLGLLGIGLLLALIVGGLLARRMVVPIRRLQQGAEKLGAGDLSQRLDIHTGDEIETLADRFNQMAERIKDSYATLEAKVEARTADLNEALQQQTATADVLKVISRSAFDLQAVFDTLLSTAVDLNSAYSGAICVRDGDVFRYRARRAHGSDDRVYRYLLDHPATPGRSTIVGRTILSGHVEQIPDILKDEEYAVPTASLGDPARAMLGVPLIGKERVEGAIVLTRLEPGLYSKSQIETLKTFADQAVIAIENARLLDEVRAKTTDLEEALERQTATSKILAVIASSPANASPVFEAIAASANAVVRGHSTAVFRFIKDRVHLMALTPTTPAADETLRATFPLALAEFPPFAQVREGLVSQIPDTEIADMPRVRDIARGRGYRSMAFAPLIHQGRPVGVISVTRPETGAFAPADIAQLRAFADQAVIAIENARLFEEVQARTRDLEESLAQQTATADVLKVISRSAFDLQAVFDTLIATAVDLNNAYSGAICVRDGEVFRYKASRAHDGEDQVYRYLIDHPATADRTTVAGRTILSGQVEQIPDILQDKNYAVPIASLGNPARALLGVPLLGKERVEGAIVLTRREPGLYPQRQIETLKTFADQAVIAIENARLFDQVQARTKELAQTVDDLRSAQDRLIQSEKLASLGQLTAGIAHEIKNPLNFVNNFAALSRELIEELKEVVATTKPDEKTRGEIDEIAGMLEGNLAKVVQHGKRADSIVKNMLLHSRESSGEHRPVDLNATVEEAVNLAYHGARAEKPGFNVTLLKEFDPTIGEVDLYPQEFTRVLLNLISNGFYAAAKRKAEQSEAAFEPTLKTSTKNLGDKIEIKIRDNGTGIPPEVKAKMFNPFFTTKPAGEGTGLGLSLSYDIVVKQHGGTIDVDTTPGEFTEFTLVIPRGDIPPNLQSRS
jgi:two-component system NtrC family sensor kinase